MEQKLQEAICLYQNGLSILKVTTIVNIPFGTLQSKFKELGITRSNKENSKRHTPEMLQEAIHLFRQGHNINEINRRTTVSKYTLRTTLADPDLVKENMKNKSLIPQIPSLLQAIELYKSGISIIDACDKTGACRSTLQKWLKKLEITRSNKQNSRKYKLNHKYFNIIDTEEKAYWLGFLYADGYISHHKTGSKYVGCALHTKDLPHLEKLKNCLQATYPIKTYTSHNCYGVDFTYCRLLMTSDQLFDDLLSKGVLEHKSLILKFPTEQQVPPYLINHFIRGYFDGDGSFSKSKPPSLKQSTRTVSYQVKICGTKEFLNALSAHIGFPNKKLAKRYKDNKNNYCIEIGGRKQVLAIGNYMYKNATICLERKYKRYLFMHI